MVSKSGGLIFNHEHVTPCVEHEQTFGWPLDIRLKYENKKTVVEFGERDGVRVGHVLQAVNGKPLAPGDGRKTDDGRDVFELLGDERNFPVNLKFGRARMTTNEKIFLASMFYPLFALASQLSPEPRSSGIELLEADTFKLHCFQTLTGVKLLCVSAPDQAGVEPLLRKVYELYADYALKNPFYSLEMPIRCELFETNLQLLLQQLDNTKSPPL